MHERAQTRIVGNRGEWLGRVMHPVQRVSVLLGQLLAPRVRPAVVDTEAGTKGAAVRRADHREVGVVVAVPGIDVQLGESPPFGESTRAVMHSW